MNAERHKAQEAREKLRLCSRRLLGKTLVTAVTVPVSSYAVFSLTIFSFDSRKYAIFLLAALTVVLPLVALCIALFYLAQHHLGKEISKWFQRPRDLRDPYDARLAIGLQRKIARQSILHGMLVSLGIFFTILTNILIFGSKADFDAFTATCYLALGGVVAFTNFFITFFTSVEEMKPLLSLVLEETGEFGFHETSSIGWRIAFLCAAVLILSLGISWIGFTYKTQEQVKLREMDAISTGIKSAAHIIERTWRESREKSLQGQTEESFLELLKEARREFLSDQGTLLLLDPEREPGPFIGEDMPEKMILSALQETSMEQDSVKYTRKDSHPFFIASSTLSPSGQILLYLRPYNPSFNHVGGMGMTFLVLLALVGATTAYLAHLLVHNISGPVRQLIKACRRVGKGDLSFDIRPESLDEIGELTSSYAQMLRFIRITSRRLLETSAELTEGADHVASAAQNITASIEELNALMSELNSQVEEEARRIAAMEEVMGKTSEIIRAASEKAASSLRVSLEADSWATEGKDKSREAARRIKDLVTTLEGALRSLGQLNRSSQLIGSIVEEIARIADQTNLLALNAAIEAARVQEHGRGFTVVAGEVKKLAEESASSAGRIKDVVSEIQSKVKDTMELMERSAAHLLESAGAVEAVDGSLGKLVEIVKEMAEHSRGVSAMTELEVEESRRVEESLTGMRDFVSQNLEAYREISASAGLQAQAAQILARTAEDMARTAHRLKESLKALRIAGD